MLVLVNVLHIPGQSVRGVFRMDKWLSNVPAQASLFVRKFEFRLNNFLTVAGMEECSNCECGVGPLGSWITARSKEIMQKNYIRSHMTT